MADRIALVTGATGFIGARLVAALLDAGWEVRATGRRPHAEALPPAATYQPADLAGGDDVAPLLAEVTHLFHLAGASSSQSSEAAMIRDNVVATRRLLAAASESETLERVLYMSSTSVYGEEVQLPSPVSEHTEPQPSRAYGKAKWAAEQVLWSACREGVPVVVVRPVSVFGPGNIKLLASAVLDAAIERFSGEDVLVAPATPVEQRLVHIDDVLQACLHLSVHPASTGQAFNVVFPEYPTSHEVAGIIAGAMGMTIELRDDPDCGYAYERRAAVRNEMLAAGMRPDILLTKDRFRFMRKANLNNRLSVDALLATGFRFAEPDLERAIAATIGWYREQRWIL
ncbi:MAG TPA: NAD(P)-dependent oxidoreductase [Acidimicrobiales bacterium]|jgi:nucleoside-diphosphate-sugar epimerase|nr:NAD(P)-dependent oxidoreductase [Acidimicrobiales bacterium]